VLAGRRLTMARVCGEGATGLPPHSRSSVHIVPIRRRQGNLGVTIDAKIYAYMIPVLIEVSVLVLNGYPKSVTW
jgi:hypothetical protein